MQQSVRNQAMALAGVMHATSLVRQLAREGRVPDEQLACALRPVFALDPEAVDAVYTGEACRRSALVVLQTQLGGTDGQRDMETTRYAATLMHLERKLAGRRDLMTTLREGLEAGARQLEHYPVTHDNIVARLADLYSRTVSQLKPRVMVQGDARFLEEPGTANRVRALLLAGIRSAVLWRQCGGSRLRLIFSRNRLIAAALELDAT